MARPPRRRGQRRVVASRRTRRPRLSRSALRAHSHRRGSVRSRWKCIVALGLPVVPEVKPSSATSSRPCLHRIEFHRLVRGRCGRVRHRDWSQPSKPTTRLRYWLFLAQATSSSSDAGVAEGQRNFRLVDDLRQFAREQHRHGVDDDGAGLGGGEPARRPWRDCWRSGSARDCRASRHRPRPAHGRGGWSSRPVPYRSPAADRCRSAPYFVAEAALSTMRSVVFNADIEIVWIVEPPAAHAAVAATGIGRRKIIAAKTHPRGRMGQETEIGWEFYLTFSSPHQ